MITELDKFLESKLLEFKNREKKAEELREHQKEDDERGPAAFLAGVGISAEFGFGAVASRIRKAKERVARLKGRDDLTAAVEAFWQFFETLSEGTGFRSGEAPKLSLRLRSL